MRRLAIVVALVLGVMLGAASNARAHTRLTASSPAEGEQIATAPDRGTLVFSEPVDPGATTVTIRGADSTTWSVGAITVSDTTLTVPVLPAGPAGQYTLTYRIISADGDPVTGTIRFSLATAVPPLTTKPTFVRPSSSASPAPAVQSADADEGGIPVWVWFLLAAVVLLLVAVMVHRGSTRSSSRRRRAG